MMMRMTENELISRVHNGDKAAYEPLLEPYQPLLRALAHRFYCPGGLITQAELIQAGYLGLMQAAKRFNIGMDVRFITYALPWALGEMKRALKSAVDSTGVYEKRRMIARREAELSITLSRAPRIDELAEACGLTPQEIVRVLEASVSASVDLTDQAEHSPLSAGLCGETDMNLEGVDLRMALEKLSQQERQIVMLRFFRGRTQRQTAQTLGKSQAQISKLENRALDRLREMLT